MAVFINKGKPLHINEIVTIIQDKESCVVSSIPLRPKGGEVYLFQGDHLTKDDWKSDGHM